MPDAAQMTAFSHLALVVGDIESMASFYADALGFRRGEPYTSAGRRVAGLMECDPQGFTGVFLSGGGLLLELLQYIDGTAPQARPRPANKRGFAHISFVADDIDAVLARVEAAGGSLRTRLDHRFAGPEESIIEMCLDPEGNRIELVAHQSTAESDAHAAYLGLAGLGWPGRDVVERTAVVGR
jgi:predicted enzyme related to lactoylglutathione lyase